MPLHNCLGEAVIFSTAESRCQTVLSVWQSKVHMNCMHIKYMHTYLHIYCVLHKWQTCGIGNQCKLMSDRTKSIYKLFNKKIGRSFSLCCHTHIGTGVHLTSYPKCTSGSFPGNKASGLGNKPLTLI